MEKQNQFEFNPFDAVLVRITDGIWKADLFSHINTNEYGSSYCCITGNWEECILYNEETAHLIGTNKPYLPKAKEITYEVTYGFGNDKKIISYTEEGFKEFINKAVCNNKDIKNFTVNMIIPDRFQIN